MLVYSVAAFARIIALSSAERRRHLLSDQDWACDTSFDVNFLFSEGFLRLLQLLHFVILVEAQAEVLSAIVQVQLFLKLESWLKVVSVAAMAEI